jgi:hypothetical protein
VGSWLQLMHLRLLMSAKPLLKRSTIVKEICHFENEFQFQYQGYAGIAERRQRMNAQRLGFAITLSDYDPERVPGAGKGSYDRTRCNP